MKKLSVFAAIVLMFLATSVIHAEDLSGMPFDLETVMVSMPDGVKLATDIYFPKDVKMKMPVVLMRTPYGKGNWGPRVVSFLSGQKLIFVIQDTRGRFDSEGVSTSFLDDPGDGYETVEWIARQPWSNGKIGTAGISAMGITQYQMVKSAPPSLDCMSVMAAAPSLYHTAAYQGGAMRRSLMFGWMSGNDFPLHVLQIMLSNVDYNELWYGLDSTRDYAKATFPAMHFGGWYDMFLQGNLDAFVGLEKNGGPGAKGKQLLVVGPWTHYGFLALAGPKQGELTYPQNSAYDIFKLSSWFQECLMDRDKGFLNGPKVRYYVMGDVDDQNAPGNEWRKADAWPIPSSPVPFYLEKDGLLTTALPAADNQFKFNDDPANPTPTIGGANLQLPAGPMDQREIEKRDDVLVFTTPVLEEPLEVTGQIKATIYLTTDVADTDITVRLTDVYPDGRSMLVTDGIVRASHRESLTYRKPLVPGEKYALDVDLWATSLIFNKGHKIRVIVAGTNFPRFDVNRHDGSYHNLGPGELEKAKVEGIKKYINDPDAGDSPIIAHNVIHTGMEGPSHILLPIVK